MPQCERDDLGACGECRGRDERVAGRPKLYEAITVARARAPLARRKSRCPKMPVPRRLTHRDATGGRSDDVPRMVVVGAVALRFSAHIAIARDVGTKGDGLMTEAPRLATLAVFASASTI